MRQKIVLVDPDIDTTPTCHRQGKLLVVMPSENGFSYAADSSLFTEPDGKAPQAAPLVSVPNSQELHFSPGKK
jgi:hypothetical protein